MAAPAAAPVNVNEVVSLPSLGINQSHISFTHVTMESEKYICVRETSGNNTVVIVDMASPTQPLRRQITADSALMNPVSKVIALKAVSPGTTTDHLQIFNLEMKTKIKSFQMSEAVAYWKWISPSMLGLVTSTAVYHWDMEGASEPVKKFDRTANLQDNQIINYRSDPSGNWLVLIGIAPGAPERAQLVKGNMQLYSVEQKRSQALEAHAASFATLTVPGAAKPLTLIAFAMKTLTGGTLTSKLHVIELGAQPGSTFQKKQADLFFPPGFEDDFPVSMQVGAKHNLIYVITKLGLLFVYDLETASAIYRNRISPDPFFLTADAPTSGGFYAINRRGQVLHVTLNEGAVVSFVSEQLNNLDLALAIAQRGNLPGAEALVMPKFDSLFQQGKYKEAAELAAESPQGTLRTREVVARFQQVPGQPGQTPPLLQYFGTLLTKGKLNDFESVELARLVVSQNKKQLLEGWLGQDQLEPSEALGDIINPVDPEMALKVYVKAKASPKVVQMLAERGEFDKMVKYSQQVSYTPDYLFLLQKLLQSDPQAAVNLATAISAMTPPPVDMNTMTDLFLQRNMIKEATEFLLPMLKPNLPEHASLQTKVLEINLIAFPNVAEAILANGMFTHYDRPRIAQLCEKAGLYMKALQHYTELTDIKRVVVNTHAIEPQSLVEFFGTLSREWALECLKELLTVNMRQNLQLVVQTAKEYTEQLKADAIIELLESFKSYEGLYFYLGSYLAFSEDPEVHFKYIEAAAKTGQIKEVERVTRESTVFDPERTKLFLMEAKLSDARPLINVCDRFDLIPDLTNYLYSNNMMRYIEGYVQKVNPSNTPLVVGSLLDLECTEDFIKNLILSVRSLLPVEPLVAECEKRNRLKLLTNFLEHLVSEGSQDPHVHNALGKIIIDSNNNPEHFLTTNPYYDSEVVGKYCEKRDPTLACVAFKRGQCDMELVDITNRNSLFKVQARYVVERMDQPLWETVLDVENPHRRQLIDQVVSTALPESKNPEQVSVTVKAFMNAELPNELIELLEKIVLQNSAFSGNPNLQNLLILTAIKADKTRVMDYINRLESFDGPAVGDIAVGSELYEEAFIIFKKFDQHVPAVKVLLDNIAGEEGASRALEYANKVEKEEVWSVLGGAQLAKGDVGSAITSFIKANDASEYAAVVDAAKNLDCYEDLVKYLEMSRKKLKESKIDTELLYALAKTNQLSKLEEFISGPHTANIQNAGDKCFEEGLFEAAKILYSSVSAWGGLASTLVRLHQFQQAVEAARRANSSKTWKEVCFACVEEGEFRLAQLCGLNIIVQADELEEISDFYQAKGQFEHLLALMESGLGLERSHMGIFTELGILYAKYKPEKLMEHLKLFATRINIPKLIRVCEEQQHWKELAYLYINYDEYDNAATIMMQHSPTAWEHVLFKDVAVKVANVEIYYKALQHYLDEHPNLINDLLTVLTARVDHSRVVDLMRKMEHLPLVRPYLNAVQNSNTSAVNEAINELCIQEEDAEALRTSIDTYDNFDQIALAYKCESHSLQEFRRIASYIYKQNQRWRQSVDLSKKDNLFKDAMETCAQSKDRELAEELLNFFVKEGKKDCFAACLFTCYDLLRPDVVLEMAWMNGMNDFAMPFMIQCMRDLTNKMDTLMQEKEDRKIEAQSQKETAKEAEAQQNMYAQLLPPALPAAPYMPGQEQYMQQGQMPQQGYMQQGQMPAQMQQPYM